MMWKKIPNFTSGDPSPNSPHKINEEGGKTNATVYKFDEHGSLCGRDTKGFAHIWKILMSHILCFCS